MMSAERYPIVLGINRPPSPAGGTSARSKGGAGASGSSSSAGGQTKLSAEERVKILERDGYTCRCCGLKSKKYQEILYKNMRTDDISPENLLTVCIFCHQCFHLDQVSKMRSGILIWLPEIDQATLHHIARAIYVARISQGPIAEAARKSLDILMSLREEAKRRIQTDEPYILATVLRDYLGEKHYGARDKKLEGLRLFPLDRRIIKEADLEFNQFPQILAYWRSKDGPFGGKAPTQWVSIYQQLAQAA
jgi:intracellular multiplication protein IcmJ